MSAAQPPSQTAARASLALSLPGTSAALAHGAVIQEGWVLKKRRKKMQGFARRYFVLYQSGLLAYSFEPGQPVRDQVSLPNAAISTAPGRKDIHIDSSNATFHVKCLSTGDFNLWMAAFRRFAAPSSDLKRSGSLRASSRQSTTRPVKSGLIAEEMGSTLAELEAALNALGQEQPRRPSSSRGKPEKDRPKDAMFGLFKRSHSGDGTSDEPNQPMQRVKSALDILKSQHGQLLKALTSMSFDPISPLVPLTEKDDELSSSPISTRLLARASISTSFSDSLTEWYDAPEGVQEFELEQDDPEPSKIIIDDSKSSLEGDSADTDTDINDVETEGDKVMHVVRRNQLPVPPVADEGSLFAILKKNVGKDLATIQFPVTFNEPLTLLQRAAEELEYYDILNEAAKTSDLVERMSFVAAFAVSQYAHTRHRSGRKGFNPMLGETFEDVRMKLIAEKVRHNPVEMAYHAEGKGWEFYATSAGKTKFWGKSLEIIPLGVNHVKIGSDHYQWKKPSSFIRNLMVGTKYLEHVGTLTIENIADRSRCTLDFKQSGYWAPSNVVSGSIADANGQSRMNLEGKWDDQFSQTMGNSHLRVLWRATPWPKNTEIYYGFTSFGITLNEITSDIAGRLPPTDSRNRPDVRALEEGELDLAEEEKQRVEELQRERRKKGKDRQPRWFKQVGDEWVYTGGYWEARAKGWKGEKIEPLW